MRWILVLVALLPLPAIAALSIRVADHLARSLAIGLDQAAHTLFGAESTEPRWVYVEPLATAPVANQSAEPERRGGRSAVLRGIRVRESAVLRIANAGQRPSGIPVPALGARPAGLALVGVSGLGIGLEDGDILIQAAGRQTRAPGDVIGVVLGSRAKRVPEISGRFWRNGEAWSLVVEQPYVRRHDSGVVAFAR